MPTVPLIKDLQFSLKRGDFRFIFVKSVDFLKDYLFLQEVQFGSQLRVQGRLRGRIIYLRVEFSWLGWVLMNSSEVILDIGSDTFHPSL